MTKRERKRRRKVDYTVVFNLGHRVNNSMTVICFFRWGAIMNLIYKFMYIHVPVLSIQERWFFILTSHYT